MSLFGEALRFTCPTCNARPGVECQDQRNEWRECDYPHQRRLQIAREARKVGKR